MAGYDSGSEVLVMNRACCDGAEEGQWSMLRWSGGGTMEHVAMERRRDNGACCDGAEEGQWSMLRWSGGGAIERRRDNGACCDGAEEGQ